MEAWPNRQFLKVRVETVQATKITFIDAENRNRFYLWEKPGRNKNRVVVEQGQLVTLLANIADQKPQGDKEYCTLKRVKVLS